MDLLGTVFALLNSQLSASRTALRWNKRQQSNPCVTSVVMRGQMPTTCLNWDVVRPRGSRIVDDNVERGGEKGELTTLIISTGSG